LMLKKKKKSGMATAARFGNERVSGEEEQD